MKASDYYDSDEGEFDERAVTHVCPRCEQNEIEPFAKCCEACAENAEPLVAYTDRERPR